VRDDWLPLASGLRATPEEAWDLLSATLFVGTVGETLEDANKGLFAGCAPAKQVSTPAHVAGLQPGDRFYRLTTSRAHVVRRARRGARHDGGRGRRGAGALDRGRGRARRQGRRDVDHDRR
jgi:hypothetical protein